MDDGLQASLVLTRSCESITKWVRDQKVISILSQEDSDTRLVSMKGRLKDAPRFDPTFLKTAVMSLSMLEPLCGERFQVQLLDGLRRVFESLSTLPFAAYRAYVRIDTIITTLDHTSLLQLLEPSNETNQLLLAHLVALHLLMRPISCRERKQHTASMYGIRMNTWIPGIYNTVSEGKRPLLEWPMWVAGLHVKGELEQWSLPKTGCS